jgi:hypothetical protein
VERPVGPRRHRGVIAVHPGEASGEALVKRLLHSVAQRGPELLEERLGEAARERRMPAAEMFEAALRVIEEATNMAHGDGGKGHRL